VPVRFARDGSLFAGGTARGWGSRGTKQYSLERLVWTGKTGRSRFTRCGPADGFELTFTQPLDSQAAAAIESYKMKTFTYIYQATYGSPEVDETTPKITQVELGKDGKSVRLYVDKAPGRATSTSCTCPASATPTANPCLHPGGVLHDELHPSK